MYVADTETGTLFIKDHGEIPVQIRSVIVFAMGLVPASLLLTLASNAVPNLGLLEASLFDTILSVAVFSALLTLVIGGGRIRVLVYAMIVAVTAWWILALYQRYGHGQNPTVSISIWMMLVIVAYIIRVDLLYRRHDRVLDTLHAQFKLDCWVIVTSIGYFILSSVFEYHFAGLPTQIAVLDVGCIALWAFALWQMENKVTENVVLSGSSYLGLFLALVVTGIVEVPAVGLMGQVSVAVRRYHPPGVVYIANPKYHAKPHPKPKVSGTNAALTHWFVIIFLVVAVLSLVVYFILSKKKSSRQTVPAISNSDLMQMVERQTLTLKGHRVYVATNQPIRKRVQRWLKRRERQGSSINPEDSIRSMLQRSQSESIGSILEEYEQVRYDPSADSEKL